MTYLISVGRASIEPALECLAEDRIERLFHAEIHDGICKSEDKGSKESIHKAFFFKSLQDDWCVSHANNKSFKIAFC